MDMVDLQPTLVEFLVRHVLLSRELLPQIEINSSVSLDKKREQNCRESLQFCSRSCPKVPLAAED